MCEWMVKVEIVKWGSKMKVSTADQEYQIGQNAFSAKIPFLHLQRVIACIPRACRYLISVYLTGVYFIGVHLMGVHLTGVHLMGVSPARSTPRPALAEFAFPGNHT